jgi:putative tryptophan/tyrosine transport system substrate-binding protein
MRAFGFVSVVIASLMFWPLPLSAQEPAAVVGFLTSGSLGSLNKQWIAAVHRGLRKSGYIHGHNVSIEYRAADNNYDRLPSLAADLVHRQVGVIVAAGGPVTALAAKNATQTIPIVFTTVADPFESGLVASADFNRPGGNLTGTAGLTSELDAKRLELLHALKPSDGVIGVLVNPKRPLVDAQTKALEGAARAIGRQITVVRADTEDAINAAFEAMAQQRVDALAVTADPLFNFCRAQVLALAARHAIPAIYQWREFAADGGLMSYGPNIADAYYQAGEYSGRILKGVKVAELPVVRPTRFELVINLKTAEALRLAVPDLLRTIATETIE